MVDSSGGKCNEDELPAEIPRENNDNITPFVHQYVPEEYLLSKNYILLKAVTQLSEAITEQEFTVSQQKLTSLREHFIKMDREELRKKSESENARREYLGTMFKICGSSFALMMGPVLIFYEFTEPGFFLMGLGAFNIASDFVKLFFNARD